MWREPRLFIPQKILGNSSYISKDSSEDSSEDCQDDQDDEALIPVNLELVNLLWLPNIFVYNLKTFKARTLELFFAVKLIFSIFRL